MIKSNTHTCLYFFSLLCLVWVNLLSVVLAHPAIESDKPVGFTPDLDLVEDDGNAENAILNYLFAKQFINRMRHQLDIRDLQRKRSYWKQCAFNAVSCFG